MNTNMYTHEDLKKAIDESLDIFLRPKLLDFVEKNINNNSLLDYQKSFLVECKNFYYSLKLILDLIKDKKIDINTEVGKMFIYPILRRLYEVFFNQEYIFHNKNKKEKRYKSFCLHVKKEYKSLYRKLKEYSYPNITKLPILQEKINDKYPSLAERLKVIKNDDGYDFLPYYNPYKIMCFYTHGTINSFLLKNLFNTSDFMAIKDPKELLGIIANGYLTILSTHFNYK